MGLLRKAASVNTMGLVKYRGDREAIVHVARKQAERSEKKARAAEHDESMARARRQIEQMRAENVARKEAKAAARVPDPVLPFLPAGWYPDQADPALVRWFDGAAWTDQTSPPPGHWAIS